MDQNTQKIKLEPYDYLVKILLLGDSGVGKSNILLRTCESKFKQDYISTIGIDFRLKMVEIQGKKLKMQIWDTAGQERFQTITQTFYKGAMGVILVYSVTDLKSFQNVQKWIEQIKQNADRDVIVILVANKSDLKNNRVITHDQGLQQSKKLEINFIESSAKDNTNIENIFQLMAQDIHDQIQKDIEEDIQTHRQSLIISKNNQSVTQAQSSCFC